MTASGVPAQNPTAAVPVVIIGAGPAGLATAACLKQWNVDALVLEAGPSLGNSWRNHYDRLHDLLGMPIQLTTIRFRPALAELVGVPGVLDDSGSPRDWRGGGACPNLFFVGYEIVPTGHLREMAIRAEAVAAEIAGAGLGS